MKTQEGWMNTLFDESINATKSIREQDRVHLSFTFPQSCMLHRCKIKVSEGRRENGVDYFTDADEHTVILSPTTHKINRDVCKCVFVLLHFYLCEDQHKF